MATLDKAIIAKYKKEGYEFEIWVDPDLALEVRRGKDVDIDSLLVIDKIFKNAKSGELASEEGIKKVFGNKKFKDIVYIIIRDGKIELTTEQRRKLLNKKKEEIIQIIHRNAINPKTKTPHPPKRIELAMEQAKVHIDIFKPAEEQVNEIIEKIKTIIPIKVEMAEIEILIPSKYSGRAFGIIKKYNVKKEKWMSDGSLYVVLEIPAGLVGEISAKLNNLTQGSVKIKSEL